STILPYTTLFRSCGLDIGAIAGRRHPNLLRNLGEMPAVSASNDLPKLYEAPDSGPRRRSFCRWDGRGNGGIEPEFARERGGSPRRALRTPQVELVVGV